MIYVNQVGGNDELVFDGTACVFDAQGNVIAPRERVRRGPDLRGLTWQGVSARAARGSPSRADDTPQTGVESIYRALVLGLRDYVRKCGFESVVLGLSGGIDSALTAALAVAALARTKSPASPCPADISSDHSVERRTATRGEPRHRVPHRPDQATFTTPTSTRSRPSFSRRRSTRDVTEENIQARIRGATLMAFSNRFNHLLLTTGNKSEIGRRLLHALRRHVRRACGHQRRAEDDGLGNVALDQPA